MHLKLFRSCSLALKLRISIDDISFSSKFVTKDFVHWNFSILNLLMYFLKKLNVFTGIEINEWAKKEKKNSRLSIFIILEYLWNFARTYFVCIIVFKFPNTSVEIFMGMGVVYVCFTPVIYLFFIIFYILLLLT